MKKSHKYLICMMAICMLLILLIVFLSQFVAIHVDNIFGKAGACISVALDKKAVQNADKVVLYAAAKTVTVTDEALIKEISDELQVANCTDLCGAKRDWWIEIYDGDQLVRRMRWEDCHELVEVYTADFTHWVWPSETKIGLVELSDDLKAKLYQLVDEA